MNTDSSYLIGSYDLKNWVVECYKEERSVRELRSIAKELGLRRYYNLSKAELIIVLENAIEQQQELSRTFWSSVVMRFSRWYYQFFTPDVPEYLKSFLKSFENMWRNLALADAAHVGHRNVAEICVRRGATDFDWAMESAAKGGYIEIEKLCKEWGANNFNWAMECAAKGGYIEIVKLCIEWGATDFDRSIQCAVENGHIEIVKLCRDWLGYEEIHEELLKYHHKRKFYRDLHNDLLPVAWHPNRWWNWCVDEEEKRFLEEMWKY